MPGTAKGLGVKDPYDLEQAMVGAAKYLKQLGANDNPDSDATKTAIKKYNAGPAGNLNNPETNAYLPKVLDLGKKFGDKSVADRVTDPVKDAAGAVGDAAGGVVDAATAIPNFLNSLGSAIFSADWWLRAGLVIAGVVALIVGTVFFTKEFGLNMSPIGQVAKTVINPKK